METKEILEKAIQKVIDNGGKDYSEDIETAINAQSEYLGINYLYGILFNHDFAKALWGNKQIGNVWIPYLWHLQQMVISDDPIKYLGENI